MTDDTELVTITVVVPRMVAQHVAIALNVHRQRLAKDLLRTPRGLPELIDVFARAATGRHQPPTVADGGEHGHGGLVAPRLLRFTDCATSLSVSKRTVERLERV